MAGRRRIHGTTHARRANGEVIPSTLPDELVGPVETRYEAPMGEEELELIALFVVDALKSREEAKLVHHEMWAVISGIVREQKADKNLPARTICPQVIDFMLNRDMLRIVSNRGSTNTYGFGHLKMTKDEALARTMELCRQQQAEIAHLKEQLEKQRRQHSAVDEKLLRSTATKLAEVTKQRDEFEAALEEAQAQVVKTHAELDKLKAKSQAEQQGDTLDSELVAQLKSLGVEFD